MFGIGQKPSGAADPYGLRRAAIGVIRIITEKELKLPLAPVLDEAFNSLAVVRAGEGENLQMAGGPQEPEKFQVFEFILDRLQALLAERGVPTDVAAAVLAVSREKARWAWNDPNMPPHEQRQIADNFDDLIHIKSKALALAQVKETAEFKPLAVGMKRVMNILRKEAGQVPAGPPSAKLMTEEAEASLHRAFQGLAAAAEARLAQGDYLEFLRGLSALKQPIDKFFDDVLVMDPDQKVRANRLALLNEIAGLFRQVAEFTHLQLA
jgi:glycyl-tRNA synthetase beta chain